MATKMTYIESGRLGGQQTSAKKAKASMANGRKGGRPNRALLEFAEGIYALATKTKYQPEDLLASITIECALVLHKTLQ